MSVAESEIRRQHPEATTEAGDPFVESEAAETRMTYDRGGLPWYLVALWIGVLAGVGIYAAGLLAPDLGSWGLP
jgi:hypothetical protein